MQIRLGSLAIYPDQFPAYQYVASPVCVGWRKFICATANLINFIKSITDTLYSFSKKSLYIAYLCFQINPYPIVITSMYACVHAVIYFVPWCCRFTRCVCAYVASCWPEDTGQDEAVLYWWSPSDWWRVLCCYTQEFPGWRLVWLWVVYIPNSLLLWFLLWLLYRYLWYNFYHTPFFINKELHIYIMHGGQHTGSLL